MVQSRVLILAGSLVAYLLGFRAFYSFLGASAGTLAILPVVTVASLWGAWPGVLAAGLTIGINMLLFAVSGRDPINLFLDQSVTTGSVALVFVGAVVGRLSDLGQRSQRLLKEQEQRDEALAREQGLMNALMDNIPDAIYFKDTQGRFIRVSKALVAKHGMGDPEQVLGKTDFDFFEREHAQATFDREQDIIRTGQPLVNLEVPEIWSDHRMSWASVTKMPLRDPAGTIIGLFGVSRDITDRKAAAEAIELLAQELESRNVRLESLYQTGQILNATLEMELILEALTDEAIRVTGASHGQVLVVNGEKGCYERRVLRGFSPGEVERARSLPLPLKKGLNGQAYLTRQTLRSDDVSADPSYFALISSTRSEMAVPIVRDDEVIGNLDLQSPKVGAFANADLDYLKALANQAAIAIRNAQIFERSQRHIAEMELLHQTTLEITRQLDLDRLLHTLIQSALHLLGADSGGVYLYRPDQNILEWAVSVGPHVPPVGKQIQPGEGLSGRVWRTGKPLAVIDYATWEGRSRAFDDYSVHGIMAVPVRWGEFTLGILCIVDGEASRRFSEQDKRMLSQLADQAAIAIHNAQLYQELEAQRALLERKVGERTFELQQARERVEGILNAVGEALMVIDGDGRIHNINPAFEEQTGYPAYEIELRSYRDLVIFDEATPDPLVGSRESLNSRWSWHGEAKARRRDGSSYEVALTLTRTQNGQGGSPSFVAAMRDITPLKDLQRMKDAFVSNVSHELRTPIASIKLNQRLLEMDPEQHEIYTQRLRRETNRLTTLIEDLLHLSRLDQGQMPVILGPLNLNSVLAQYVSDRTLLAEEQGLKLSWCELSTLPRVRADGSLIGQVLSILLTNAIHYTPSGGEITVSTLVQEREGVSWAGFSVADTGRGILPDDMPRLFERFYRGQAGRQSGAPGTGLGLAIAKEIVTLHAGYIEVSSEGLPGRGTTFTVWLPLA